MIHSSLQYSIAILWTSFDEDNSLSFNPLGIEGSMLKRWHACLRATGIGYGIMSMHSSVDLPIRQDTSAPKIYASRGVREPACLEEVS